MSCLRRGPVRVDAFAALLVVATVGGFALRWSGSDAWLWLAPVAFMWYLIGLWAFRYSQRGAGLTLALGLAALLGAAGAWRSIEAPCLLTAKASQPVRAALAYGRHTGPEDRSSARLRG